MSALVADREQIARFAEALFKHAAPGGFVSLRSLTHESSRPIGMRKAKDEETGETVWRFICEPIAEQGLRSIIDRAGHGADYAANFREPAVFCPPICTFANDKRGRVEDLANGLALSVECDQKCVAARSTLENLLGPPTLVVESGGEWPNPESGRTEKKLHLHWRLDEPTRTENAHKRLREARRIATDLVGGDTTNITVVHPIRWAGSWHTKDPARPRLARIVAESDNEIDLYGALDALAVDYGQDAGAGMEGCERSERQDDAHWRKLALGVERGTTGRIDAVISVFGYLLALGVQRHLAGALARGYNSECCRPPLDKKKVDAALVSIFEREKGK
jgi:hypothetical protein